MNIKQRGIFGILAATVAISAMGVVLPGCATKGAATTPILPGADLGNGPKVASTQPGGPVSPDSDILNGLLLAKNHSPGKDSKTDSERIAQTVGELLTQGHYSQHPLDTAMGEKFLGRLLSELDPRHVFFLQTDLADFDQFKPTLGDMTLKGDITPATTVFARFKERVAAQVEFATGMLKNEKFDFTGSETFPIDRKEAAAPANIEAAKKLWRDQVRYEYLQEKLAGQKPEAIVQLLTRRYTRFGRAVKDWDEYDTIERYLDALAHAYDPHTDYLGKATTDSFNINYIELSLVGIGAQLQSEDGYTKVAELIAGGPAERSKLLKAGDRIVAVAQGDDGEFVDTIDMKIDKVVEMIRGKKGTVVRLKLIPANAPDPSTRKVIRLVRDEVKIEDQAAKGRIYEMPDAGGKTVRVGVIDLPTFYGKEGADAKSATSDIAKLLKKFKEEKVAGVILDLRRNGGGLLTEAVSLTGLFIKQGPVVQVKDYTGKVRVESDDDPAVAYDGPLVVLTSRLSASASEIVTGALQDYGRAVVVGDTSTFGKGTVQVVLPLRQIMSRSGRETAEEPGTLHLTIQKFYRASGASTQLKGVTPDIILPSVTDIREIGEKYYNGPLPWDTIPAAKDLVNSERVTPYLVELKKRSTMRLALDPDFKYLKAEVERAKKLNAEKTISLNEKTRRSELDAAKARLSARRKELAKRGAGSERIYVLSPLEATKPGLPTAMTAKQLADAAKKPARPSDDSTDEADIPDVPEVDFQLDEAKRVIRDYASLIRK